MLIVTAYYDIPSKQSKENYIKYIKLFFKYITEIPVIFFTDEKHYLELKNFSNKNVTFHILNFEDLSIFNNFPINFWKEQIKIDPEKYHTWQLGAVWANKSYFIKTASEIYKNYDWYMWVDAGCVRCEEWEPILKEFGKRNKSLSPGVYIQSLNDNIPNKDFFIYVYGVDYIAGSHILFHKDYIDKYVNNYAKMITYYVDNSIPIIMDQYIITSMFLKHDFIHKIELIKNISVIDKWFFFFYIF